MGINLGGFIAPIACSTVAEYDMHMGFGLAGLGMVFGLIQYRLTGDSLAGLGEVPIVKSTEEIAARQKLRSITSIIGLVGAVIIAVLFTGVIPIDAPAIAGASGTVIAIVAFGYLGYVISLVVWIKWTEIKLG
jgi:proton-dependent oligopeptide transporter, POT family